jgi:hypothetical protein
MRVIGGGVRHDVNGEGDYAGKGAMDPSSRMSSTSRSEEAGGGSKRRGDARAAKELQPKRRQAGIIPANQLDSQWLEASQGGGEWADSAGRVTPEIRSLRLQLGFELLFILSLRRLSVLCSFCLCFRHCLLSLFH